MKKHSEVKLGKEEEEEKVIRMELVRTEQIWLKPNETISRLCHLSKNLFNQGNYIIKETLNKEGKWIHYGDLNKVLKEESNNYKTLPVQTSQQILKLIDKSWSSFFRAIKEWEKKPDKFLHKPSPLKYKKKNGEYILVFTNQQCKIKDGLLKFPKKVGLEIKTRLSGDTNLREVRIIPKGVGYVCEIVYQEKYDVKKKDENRIVGIDFGSKNIIAMVNNIGLKPIVVKDGGRGIKSINQFFNKRSAKLQNIYAKQGVKNGIKMQKLQIKRDKKANDWIHKLTRWIVNWCVKYNIGTVVVGHNNNWKQKIKLGKRNNQNFVLIPFDTIIQKLSYKLEEVGITLKEQEESHTSICSFLDDEPIEYHNKYIGKRIMRGLFRTAKGLFINADVNAGYNIIKKAIPDFDGGGGCALHPLLVVINNKYREEYSTFDVFHKVPS